MSIRRFILLISLFAPVLLPLAAVAQEQPQPTFTGQIAYIGADGNLWVLRSDSQIPIPITYDATTERRYHSPIWSADGSRLAYCVSDEEGSGKGQLYMVWSGEWLPFLVSQDVHCKDSSIPLFDWSLDGLQLYYARAFAPASAGDGSVWGTYAGIWQANIISGAQSELIPPPGDNPLIYPDLSPDGRWMRFYEVIYFEGLGVLRNWQLESSSLANWLGLGANLFPGLSDWSPDGTQVVFDQVTYGGFPGAALFVSAPDGSGLRKVFSNPEAAAIHPLWSPDGQNIAFSAAMFGEPGARLVLIDPNGENLRRLYHGPDSLIPLVWAPDSTQLLFGYSEGEHIILALYDLASDLSAPLTTASDWAVDWAPLPQQPPPAASLPQDVLLDFPHAEGLLFYISPDYRLVLANAQTGAQVDLTRPMALAGFTPSPSRRSLVYGNRWLVLDFRESGKLSLHTVALPSAPQNGSINWSPDETHLSFRGQDGAVWLVRQDGNAVRVPNAASLPEWSYNGSWLSYCSVDGGLWLIGASTPPTRIAMTGICQHRWSSGQDLLAYTVQDASAINGFRSYLYNPVTGESTLLSEGMLVESWSPDGKYIALTRPTSAGFSAFAVNPASGKQLYIGDFDQRGLGLQSWLVSGDGYFYGGYRLAADLSAASKVADILFDASDDGNTLLVGVGAYDLVTLVCLKPAGGEETNVLTANLATIPPEQKPGIWAQLSSDGEWLLYQVADSAGMRAGLVSCDGRSQEQLAAVKIPVLDGFSADGGWFAQSEPDAEGAGQLLLRNLGGGEDRVFPAMSSSPAYWIGNLRHGPPETYLISGKVTDTAGQPVSGVTILLDDQPATTTAEDGTYVISGLKAGKYNLSPQGNAAPFEPERRRVSLPPDALQVDFTSQKAVPTATIIAGVSATLAAPLSTPTPTPLYWPANVQQVPGFLEGFLVANGLPQGSSLLLLLICGALLAGLLIVLLILLIARRRKSTSDVRMPAPEVPFSPGEAGGVNLEQAQPAATQPTRIASQPSAALEAAPALSLGAKPLPSAKQADTQPVRPENSDAQLYQLLKQGIAHVKGDNFKDGMRELRHVVQAQPYNANAWLWLGWSAAKQGDRRTAYNCFKRAQTLGHPKAEEALRWIGSK